MAVIVKVYEYYAHLFTELHPVFTISKFPEKRIPFQRSPVILMILSGTASSDTSMINGHLASPMNGCRRYFTTGRTGQASVNHCLRDRSLGKC